MKEVSNLTLRNECSKREAESQIDATYKELENLLKRNNVTYRYVGITAGDTGIVVRTTGMAIWERFSLFTRLDEKLDHILSSGFNLPITPSYKINPIIKIDFDNCTVTFYDEKYKALAEKIRTLLYPLFISHKQNN